LLAEDAPDPRDNFAGATSVRCGESGEFFLACWPVLAPGELPVCCIFARHGIIASSLALASD